MKKMKTCLTSLLLCLTPFLASSVILNQSGNYDFNYTGTGHTMEDSSSSITRTDSVWIKFDQPFRSVPQIALGIGSLDTGGGGVACGVFSYSQNSQTGFALTLEAAPYCGVYGIRANWFATISPQIQIGYFTRENFPTGIQDYTLTVNSQNNSGGVVFLAGLRQQKNDQNFYIYLERSTVTSTSVRFLYEIGSSISNNNMVKVCVIHYSQKHFTKFYQLTGTSTNLGGPRNPSLETFRNQDQTTIDSSGIEMVEICGLVIISNTNNLRVRCESTHSGSNLNLQLQTWYDTYVMQSAFSYFFDVSKTPTIKITVSD